MAPWGGHALEAFQVKPDPFEFASSSNVIGAPGLMQRIGVGDFQNSNEREECDSTGNHRQRVTLHHAFFTVDEQGMAVASLDQDDCPEPMTVECKLGRDGHLRWMVQRAPVLLPWLNAILASTNRNPHSCSSARVCHGRRAA